MGYFLRNLKNKDELVKSPYYSDYVKNYQYVKEEQKNDVTGSVFGNADYKKQMEQEDNYFKALLKKAPPTVDKLKEIAQRWSTALNSNDTTPVMANFNS